MSGNKAADSDIRMFVASEIAYLDAAGYASDGNGITVGQLLDEITTKYQNATDSHLKGQYNTALYIKQRMEEYGAEDCRRWVVKAVSDDNANSGFYGCLLDTRDGDAVVAFRGSEDPAYNNQGVKDWGLADFGLLNNPQTIQQARAAEFTRQIYERYGDQYDGYSFTGHSLGGNLAEHATVTAPDGMSIHRCLSYDAPGFSREYMAAHGVEISRRNQYIDHFHYAAVGKLLYPLPGINYREIAAHDGDEGGIAGAFSRHKLSNIEFSPDGSVMDHEGPTNPIFTALQAISRNMENGGSFLLMLNCPQLALLYFMLDKEFELLLGMKNIADNMLKEIKQTVENIKKSVENWFRSMFGVSLTGIYEMNVSRVLSIASEMSSLNRELSELSRDVILTANKLRYNAIAGSYYRSRFILLGTKIRRDGTKAKALADAAESCARFTKDDDRHAAECFS